MQAEATPRRDGMRFRRYTEQHEQAYSFEAPEGWRVQAQILRRSPTLYRNWDVASSPDGRIRIMGALPERHLFVEPSQMTRMIGVNEGDTWNGIMHVVRYQDATTFARQHVHVIAQGCGGVQITDATERPDEAQRQEAQARQQGDWVEGARIDAAELSFSCQGPDGSTEGRVVASTIRMPPSDTDAAVWIGGLRGFLAPPERVQVARRVMKRMVATLQPNPQWKARQREAQQAQMQAQQRAYQQRTTQRQAAFNAHQQRMAQRQAAFDAHQQRMGDQRAAFESSTQSWRSNQATQDRMHDQYIGSLRGETRVWDTNTGQYYDVPMGADNYYIDYTGSTILGTPGYMAPPDPTTYEEMYQGYDYEDGGQGQ